MKPELPERFRHFAPLERAADRVLTPLEEFIHSQTATSLALLSMTLVALVLANSPLADSYHHLFEQPLSIGLGPWQVSMSLHHWINDGLMAFFFFLIGLEIKRELLVGELADLRAAMLPVLAAVGGMVVPALIYVAINGGEPTINGWGTPMATDIAFAISVLVLLGSRVPSGLVTFLIALAIVDDLGAVAVIALFYTDSLAMDALAGALAVWVLLWVFNYMGIYKVLPYALGGVLMWALMLASGVHATVAGVLTALAIPAHPKIRPQYFAELIERLLEKFRKAPDDDDIHLNETQKGVVMAVEKVARDVQPPSMRLEHSLHLPVALLVIPLFALANAGVHLSMEELRNAFAHPVSLGIIAGLVIGKMVGIAATAWLAVKLGLATLPQGAHASQLIGVGLLGGIGFTMSIFIAGLAWPGDPALLQQAKMGILLASLIAGFSGYAWLRWVSR
ncbi:sodium/proton antiporter, NhaA family [Sulfurivirga caldicuralii]|uniref:Na(+)/H(+) antiporter NhaA n=1 Tax=Sulfurivirga caldicuralii TaxID=364032 RepID=A0A1N6DT28_9GAMM|nr:Na+/H+ antiporter NhaA [Sulfurivirga caldicuralii]SIN73939.1 sodium/proton antiporter, NhaA family [Sulfurivirga caldicuralii]